MNVASHVHRRGLKPMKPCMNEGYGNQSEQRLQASYVGPCLGKHLIQALPPVYAVHAVSKLVKIELYTLFGRVD